MKQNKHPEESGKGWQAGEMPERDYGVGRPMQELDALYRLTLATSHSLDSEALLEGLYNEVQALLQPDVVVIALLDTSRNELLFPLARIHGEVEQEVEGQRLKTDAGGLTNWVVSRRKPLYIPDLDADLLPTSPVIWGRPTRSWLGVPLLANDHLVGVVSLQSFTRDAFSEADQRFLWGASHQIAMALQNARLYEAVQQRAADLEVIRLASLRLTSSLDLEAVLHAVLQATSAMMPDMQDAHIFLYEEDRLAFGAALIEDTFVTEPFSTPRQDGITFRVAREGKAIIVNNMQEDPLFAGVPEGWYGAIIGLPLRVGQRVVGVMNVAYQEPRELAQRDWQTLGLLADQAAIAIENARLHALVLTESLTDVLTGLPNRRALNERIEEEVCRAHRYGHPFALLLMDLDGFKRINDRWGHPVGDRVLQQIADLLRHETRGSDLLARYGGDEFALLLPETDGAHARRVARKLAELVKAYQLVLDPETIYCPLSLSIGVATFPENGPDAADLMSRADELLYRMKGRQGITR